MQYIVYETHTNEYLIVPFQINVSHANKKHIIRIDHDPKNVALLWALIELRGGPFVEAPLGCYQYLVIKQHELSRMTI